MPGYPLKAEIHGSDSAVVPAEDESRTYSLLIITFLNLLVFPLLYIFRFQDGNTLMSWKWTFHDVNPGGIYLIVMAVTAVSYAMSRAYIRSRYFTFPLVFASFFCVVPLWSLPEPIIDSSRYIVQAKFVELNGTGYFLREWGREINAWTDLPLVPLLYGLVFRYAGEVRLYLQLLNGMFFTCSVLVTYFLGRELWDEEKGFYAGLFLMAIPYLLVQVPLVMVDVAAMFFVIAAIYLYVRAIKTGRYLPIFVSAGSIVLALLTKYSAWVMLLIIPVITFMKIKDRQWTALKRSGQIFVIAGILSVIIFVMKADVFMQQFNMLRSFQWPALKGWREGYVSMFFFQSHPFLILLSLVSLYRAVKNKDMSLLVPGWFFLFVIFLQVERFRYIIPLLPLFALTASHGLSVIRFDDVKRYTVFSMVGISLVVVFSGYYSFLPETSMANLQNAGRYIDNGTYETARIITLPQKDSLGNTEMTIPVLDIYTKAKIFHEKGHFSGYGDEVIETTPLRFTWEYGLPEFYYTLPAARFDSTVVISGDRLNDSALKNILLLRDEEVGLVQRFESATGVFRYKSFVYVFTARPLSGYGQHFSDVVRFGTAGVLKHL